MPLFAVIMGLSLRPSARLTHIAPPHRSRSLPMLDAPHGPPSQRHHQVCCATGGCTPCSSMTVSPSAFGPSRPQLNGGVVRIRGTLHLLSCAFCGCCHCQASTTPFGRLDCCSSFRLWLVPTFSQSEPTPVVCCKSPLSSSFLSSLHRLRLVNSKLFLSTSRPWIARAERKAPLPGTSRIPRVGVRCGSRRLLGPTRRQLRPPSMVASVDDVKRSNRPSALARAPLRTNKSAVRGHTDRSRPCMSIKIAAGCAVAHADQDSQRSVRMVWDHQVRTLPSIMTPFVRLLGFHVSFRLQGPGFQNFQLGCSRWPLRRRLNPAAQRVSHQSSPQTTSTITNNRTDPD